MKLETLKTIFLVDAFTCAATFAATLFAGNFVSDFTGIATPVLAAGGIICLATAAVLVWLATRSSPPALLVWAVVIGNLGWVAASIFTAVNTPAITSQGVVITLIQAAGVLAFALLEAAGARALGQLRTA